MREKSNIESKMRCIWEWVQRIEANPHYPIQLNYFGGTYTALWKRNFDSTISFEARTPENALEGLRIELESVLKFVRGES